MFIFSDRSTGIKLLEEMHCLYKGLNLIVFLVVLIGIYHVALLILHYLLPPIFFSLSAVFLNLEIGWAACFS